MQVGDPSLGAAAAAAAAAFLPPLQHLLLLLLLLLLLFCRRCSTGCCLLLLALLCMGLHHHQAVYPPASCSLPPAHRPATAGLVGWPSFGAVRARSPRGTHGVMARASGRIPPRRAPAAPARRSGSGGRHTLNIPHRRETRCWWRRVGMRLRLAAGGMTVPLVRRLSATTEPQKARAKGRAWPVQWAGLALTERRRRPHCLTASCSGRGVCASAVACLPAALPGKPC